MVICVKRKANIFISEELSLECVLTGDNTDVLSTFTDMTNMLNVFNPSTFYSSLKRAGWLCVAHSPLIRQRRQSRGEQC